MSLAGRVGAAFLVLIAMMVALAGYHLSLVHRLYVDNRRLTRVELEISRTSLKTRRTIGELGRLTQVLYVVNDRRYVAGLERLRAEVEADLDFLRTLDLTTEEQAALAAFAVLWRDYALDAPAVETEFLRLGRQGEAQEGLVATLELLGDRLEALDAAAKAEMDSRIAAAAANAARARTTAWMTTTVAAGAALLLAALIASSVARPLHRLGLGTHEMAQGNFDFRVPESGSSELVSLARDFNAMADRLGELDRLKKDFVSTVSHDLKAPLASMQETTGLLLEGTPGALSESQERLLRLNLQCGERLSGMLGELLEAASFEAGAVPFELAPEDLAELARQTLDEAEGSLAKRELTVECELVPAPVLADRELLLRLLWNLVSNAVKFSPAGGRVAVRVRPFPSGRDLAAVFARAPQTFAGPVAVCEVEDAGPGIADGEKDLVFDRFHRADARRRGVQGTGLGLSIARAIALGHQGEVWVEDAVGAPTGSRFVLVLPLRRDPDPG